MTRRRGAASCLLGGLLLLGACAADQSVTPDERSAEPSLSPSDSAEPAGPLEPASITDEGLAALIEMAAEGAGVNIDEIRVVTAERVTWSDGSLGCPRPGQMYTQALVPGFRVVLEIDGEEHHFHAAEGGDFAFCDDPQPPIEGSAS